MTTGMKFDGADGQGEVKDRWDLLPTAAIRQIVKVLTFGAAKYGDENWRHVPDARRRYYAAAMRHLTAWWEGAENDEESGASHLAHAACCILFLMQHNEPTPPKEHDQ